jgi:protein-disulfide isomerase
MASRTRQKEEARTRRLAEERARAERDRQQRRLRIVGGIVVAAIAVVAVLIAISSTGGGSGSAPGLNTAAARQTAGTVNTLLTGIPQSGLRLGSPKAKVTVTEYGDLECPICKDFALGAENQLISGEVRSGKVQLIYRSLSTATSNGPEPGVFPTQQAAANAAGLQGLGWQYIELFYHLQGSETSSYVSPSYLEGLARLVPGLNFAKWQSDRANAAMISQVSTDVQAAATNRFTSTPTIVVQGPKGQAQPIVGSTDYGTLQSSIKLVS